MPQQRKPIVVKDEDPDVKMAVDRALKILAATGHFPAETSEIAPLDLTPMTERNTIGRVRNSAKGKIELSPKNVKKFGADFVRSIIGVLGHENDHISDKPESNLPHDLMGARQWEAAGPKPPLFQSFPLLSEPGDKQRTMNTEELILRQPYNTFLDDVWTKKGQAKTLAEEALKQVPTRSGGIKLRKGGGR